MSKIGRPFVGGRATVNIGDELLTAVDLWAKGIGISRAGAIRCLLVAALLIDKEVHSNVKN